MTEEQLDKLYEELSNDRTFNEIEESINAIQDKAIAENLRHRYCNDLIDEIAIGYISYDMKNLLKDDLVQMFIRQSHLIKDSHPIFESIAQFYLGNNELSMKHLREAVRKILPDDSETCITEIEFVDLFFVPFKNAYKGFWTSLGNILIKYKAEPGILELCRILEDYYSCRSGEECLELLIPFSQKHPELSIPKELLAAEYYDLHMWRNTISYYHMVEDSSVVLTTIDIYFSLAYSYSKIKDYKHEEMYYLKCMEIDRTWEYVRNNLGYCYYMQNRYEEALPLFKECLGDKADLPYAGNNYVRTLIKLGRNKDAKEFIEAGKFKISKDIVERVKKLSNKNEKTSSTIDIKIDEDDRESESMQVRKNDSPKHMQFSSEKILEDELEARIVSGREIFGLKLRVYEREDDYYGRQYPIPIGRLDLLCEDSENNLYIIELKKDSGYDDPFKQICEYLDYFEKSKLGKGKKVHGIICLNNPTDKLVNQVKADDRIRLFEYSVSYREIE